MNGKISFGRLNPLTGSLLGAVFGFSLFCTDASADWLHYRGPAFNGSSTEKLPATLPSESPRQLWKASLGVGTSAITVSNGRIYSMGNLNDKDVVYCLDAKTGKEVWRHEYPLGLDKRMFEGGPASTPTLDGEHVYTVSHQGDLFCLEAATGKKIWYKHYQKDLGGRRPQWGFAGSPTVEGRMLLLDVGGESASTVALDKSTGAVLWKAGNDEAGYASPVVATIGGKRTAILFKENALVGLDIKDGRELWRSGWKTSYGVNAATPIVLPGDKIFISSGYGSGCALIAIANGKATELWRNKNLKSQVNTPVAFQNHIYGLDGQADPKSPLVCLDAARGSVVWTDKSVGGGSLVIADGKLIILSERGELLIGDASPAGFKPVLRAQVLGGRCWVQPTYSGGKVFAKNNQGELVALDLSSK
ncbi:MAG: hypothetical protein JWL59_1089 [Chthoniobacteraceae bacterium]|nr:hypothetical protein [Chthoniobacteraceae bacterium]